MATNVEQLAREVRVGRRPERNTLEGTCLVEGGYVGRGAGFLVRGRDEMGSFAGYLHADCAARVRELQGR